MATIFNPWESPPSTNALSGDLASFEINGLSETDYADQSSNSGGEEPGHGDAMKSALAVIEQQSTLITRLMDMLSSPSKG